MRSDIRGGTRYEVLEKAPDAVLPATRVLPTVRWRLGTCIAFRFCAAYFTLYILATQMIGKPAEPSGDLQFPALAHAYDVGGDRPVGVQRSARHPERQR
jgi:hypothetical protein